MSSCLLSSRSSRASAFLVCFAAASVALPGCGEAGSGSGAAVSGSGAPVATSGAPVTSGAPAAAGPGATGGAVAAGGKITVRRVFKTNAAYEVQSVEVSPKHKSTLAGTLAVKAETCTRCASFSGDPGFTALLALTSYEIDGEKAVPGVSFDVEGNQSRKDFNPEITKPNDKYEMWKGSRSLHALLGEPCWLDPKWPALAPGEKHEQTYGDRVITTRIDKVEREGDKTFVTLSSEQAAAPGKKLDSTEKWSARLALDDGFTGTCHQELTSSYGATPETTTFDVTVKRTK